MDINAFIKYLSNEKRYSKHTVRSYQSDLDQFVEFCISINPEFNPIASDHHIIRKWIIFLMENGVSPRSINRKITTLKSFYKFLSREGVIEVMPTDKVVVPKMKKQLPVFVGQEPMNRLFDSFEFPDNFEGLRNRTILLAFYCTGIRVSELVSLTTHNIDFYNGQIKVLGKRNKERLVPFALELKAAFQEYLAERDKLECNHPVVFVTNAGDPIYDRLVYDIVHQNLGAVTTLEKRSP
ncbi:MAG: hypothetical protein A2W95_02905, partial [Bacteroidetes bacterium GWA2_40_14]